MTRQAQFSYEFGPFRLNHSERLLLCNGQRVSLAPKVFDTLVALVENSGHLVEKDLLMSLLWPDTFVEEATLARNISDLRKALKTASGETSYIETVPKRGYRFVAEVKESAATELIIAHRTSKRIIIQEEVNVSIDLISIAVLPFRLLSGGKGEEYLGLGMADALITRLSNIRQMVVRPTSAVMKYTAENQDAVEAGRELEVEAVLVGSIQVCGERMRVTVQMVRVSEGRARWAEKFDEEMGETFEIEDSISERVTKALEVRISEEERERVRKRYTENREAYDLYLRGRYQWNKRTEEGLHKSIEYFDRAIELDPSYALAYAGLADAYTFLGDVGISAISPREAFARGKAAAAKALEIDEGLAEAHTSLAHLNMHHFDWPAAERGFKRAIEMKPNYATAHDWYAFYLAFTGRIDDSLTEIARALELDPLSQPVNTDMAEILYFARRYDQALEQFERVLELDPKTYRRRLNLARVYEQKLMYREAIAELQEAITLSGGSTEAMASLAHAYALSGDKGEAVNMLRRLTELSGQKYVSPYDIALIYTALGDTDQAFKWLDEAYEERAGWMIYLTVDPRLDPLHADPRFLDLALRVGFTPERVTRESLPIAGRTLAREVAIESLAILPLANMSGDSNLDYLSDGISESIINALSQLRSLRVTAWSSVAGYKGREITPLDIGLALGVRAVLTGRVLQVRDCLVIKVELIDLLDSSQLWGEHYSREPEDIFAIEAEIAREISEKLRLRLTDDERVRLAKRHTEDVEAYHEYLRGRYYWNKRTADEVKRGMRYFRQAIDLDPCYGLAYTGLADSYIILGSFGIMALSPREAFPRAREAALKALEIDDSLAEAHASLAFTLANYDWDWPAAERQFSRAIELRPDYAIAHHWYAFIYLTAMGRLDEAIAEERQAQALEPLSSIISTNVGTLLYLARRYDEAIDQYKSTLEVDPDFVIAHWMLGLAYEQKAMYEEAIAAFQSGVDLSARSALSLALLGHAYAVSGKRDQALDLLDELNQIQRQRYSSAYRVAAIYAALKETDAAFESLERACEQRDAWLVWLKLDPVLDTLRSDPRFDALIERVGLLS